MLAFPASWKHKLLGMLVGIVLLQVLNLVRIVTLYLIDIHLNAFFDSAHTEIWPAVFYHRRHHAVCRMETMECLA